MSILGENYVASRVLSITCLNVCFFAFGAIATEV